MVSGNLLKQTWYYKGGNKKSELWTILHLPYTLMCISFLVIGFGVYGVKDYDVLFLTALAYFLGLGLAAHSFDQLPGMGSSYVKYLKPLDLLLTGTTSVTIAIFIGVYIMVKLNAWHLLWLMPLQTFFVVAYPVSKFAKGFFHNDFWFSFSFGFMPVMVGNYINTLGFGYKFLIWASITMIISYIEITLSRFVRKLRSSPVPNEHALFWYTELIMKPELALKLLCILSYLLAIGVVMNA